MYRDHRNAYLDRLRAEGAAAIVPTATEKTRNHDCEYRFRPDSDFWYLTGFAEPESVLLLLPALEADGPERSVLFLREKDSEQEIWTGRRLGVDAAPAALGVDEAFPIDEFEDRAPDLLRGYERLHYRTGTDAHFDDLLLGLLSTLRRRARGGVRPPAELVDPVALLHELRLRKSEAELNAMRKAAAISAEAHTAVMQASAPGVGENEMDALLEYTFRRRGSTGAAYTNIVAGGANACILHYVQNDAPMRDGELLLVDSGAEWEYYASDVTRTFPINGTFNPEQRAIYELVLDAEVTAIESVRPGTDINAIHELALGRLVDGLLELGLLSGKREDALASESYKRFFMHRTSHWLGLDVHDCGHYNVGGGARPLEPGMVLTVEPGIYIAPDDDSVEPRWRGIGVRIEDDIAVTQDGHEVLSAAIPKGVDEVEAACRGAALVESAPKG